MKMERPKEANQQELMQMLRTFNRFVLRYHGTMSIARDYGTGEYISNIEVYLLAHIHENPGITVTELARQWNRTKGAISQTVGRLADKGYVVRLRSKENAKTIHLHCSEKGDAVSRAFAAYEAENAVKLFARHRGEVSIEDANTFCRILKLFEKECLPG